MSWLSVRKSTRWRASGWNTGSITASADSSAYHKLCIHIVMVRLLPAVRAGTRCHHWDLKILSMPQHYQHAMPSKCDTMTRHDIQHHTYHAKHHGRRSLRSTPPQAILTPRQVFLTSTPEVLPPCPMLSQPIADRRSCLVGSIHADHDQRRAVVVNLPSHRFLVSFGAAA